MTHEDRVLEELDDEDGIDRFDLALATGLTRAQVSAALGRLRKKGVVECARWRETWVWWKAAVE